MNATAAPPTTALATTEERNARLLRDLHWPQLPADVNTLQTAPYLLTGLAVRDCIELGRPALMTGPVGVGKTFATARALEASGVSWVYYNAQHAPLGNALLQTLLELIGVPVPTSARHATQKRLLELLVSELSREPRTVWIDEVQNLSQVSLRHLRHIIDTPEVCSTVVFSGDERALRNLTKLEKPLLSRVARQVTFHPIDQNQLPTVLAGYHPIFEATADKLLIRWDREGPRGRLRNWAKVLQLAVASTECGSTGISPELWSQLRIRISFD